MSTSSFKNLVKRNERNVAFSYLNSEKLKHSKVAHIHHSGVEIQDYLKETASVIESKFVFALRSRMVDVRCNYRGQHVNTLCPLCNKDEDSQPHLLHCEKLSNSTALVISTPEYMNLFGEDKEERQFEKRKKIFKSNLVTC